MILSAEELTSGKPIQQLIKERLMADNENNAWPQIECWHTLWSALDEAKIAYSAVQLRDMPAEQLIRLIAPLGIRFERRIRQ